MKRTFALLLLFVMLHCGSSHEGIQKTVTPEQSAVFSLAALKKDVLENHTNPQTHLRLGLAYADLDSTDIALAYYDSALSYNPSFNEAKIAKANLLIEQAQTKNAYSLYIDVLKSTKGEDFVSEIASQVGVPYSIHQLTTGEHNNAYGYYSPDGSRIVFQSDRDGNWQIYLMDSDATQDLRLTNDSHQNEMPVFSYDGKIIAFTSTRNDSSETDRVEMKRDIYLINIEEKQTNARVIETNYDDWYPSFTDKKEEIIFVSEKDDPREVEFSEKWSDIYLKDLKDNSVLRLTQNEADDGSPSASRNDKWIVFNSNRTGNFQIYRMNKKGNLVEQLTFLNGNCGAPHFSYDGNRIAFFAGVNGNYDIYMMTSSGKKMTRLTCDPAMDAYPCFSPDGKRIIFHSNRTGKFQIYYIDLMNPTKQEDLQKQLEDRIAFLESNELL